MPYCMDSAFDRIFVINLDRSPDRWKTVTSMLRGADITRYERFRAVDGDALGPSDLAMAGPTCSRFCPRRVLAIWLSHRKIWQKMKDEGIESALVLEDDVNLAADAGPRVLRALGQLPETWDIMYLGCLTYCSPPDSKDAPPAIVRAFANAFGNGARASRHSEDLAIPGFPTGTHAYALSLKGASRLLDLLRWPRFHVDIEMASVLSSMEAFAMHPVVAYQSQTIAASLNASSCEMLLVSRALDAVPLGSSGSSVGYFASVPFVRVLDHDVTAFTVAYACLLALRLPYLVLALLTIDAAFAPRNITAVQLAFFGLALWQFSHARA